MDPREPSTFLRRDTSPANHACRASRARARAGEATVRARAREAAVRARAREGAARVRLDALPSVRLSPFEESARSCDHSRTQLLPLLDPTRAKESPASLVTRTPQREVRKRAWEAARRVYRRAREAAPSGHRKAREAARRAHRKIRRHRYSSAQSSSVSFRVS